MKKPSPPSKRKSTKPAPKKTGRKLLPIDPKIVEGMAFGGATDQEIADYVGCERSTITKRFSQILTKARAGRNIQLRKKQYQIAMEGNPTMLVWLGKVHLGQRETTVTEHTGKDGGPIEILTPEQKAARVQELLTTGLTRKPTPDAVN